MTTTLTLTAAQQAAIEDAFTLSADAGNTNNGTINWDYTITEAELDFLAAGETVTVVYTITVDDGNGGTDTRDVTINILGSNDTPIVSNVNANAVEDGATVNGSFVVTDVDATDTHSFDITGSPAEGSVINNNDGTFSFDPGTDFQDLALGETRDVTFTYTSTDDSGAGNATSTAATVTVTVTGTNDQPTVSDVGINAIEDGATVTGSFVVGDVDTTDMHSFDITSALSEGSVINNNDGTFTFNPGADFQDLAIGETRDVSFSYTTTDDSGAANDTSTAATVTITVTGTNDAPTAASNTLTTLEDVAHVFTAADFNFSDIDGDSLAGVEITSLESAGSLQLNSVDVILNQLVSKADIDAGRLRFIPAANANGAAYDSFGFKVFDGTDYSAADYTMALDVTAVNDTPVGLPKITGLVEETRTLTADTSGISDVEGLGAFSYQWYRNDAAISGATSDTYTLGTVDVGFVIKVKVSYTDGAGTDESATSEGVGPVGGLPAGSGTGIPDIEVTSDPTLPDPVTDIPDQKIIEPGTLILGETYTGAGADEGFRAYQVDPYEIPDYDRELYSDAPGTSGFLKFAVRPIIQAGTDITEELLQLFDLVRIEINEVDERSARTYLVSAGSVVMSLSLGVVAWVIQGGSIAASMLSSVTALKGLDPMPFIDNCKKRGNRKTVDASDGDQQLDEMFDGKMDAEETKSVDTPSGEKDVS